MMGGHLYDELEQQRGGDVTLDGLFAGTIAETAATVADEVPVLLDGWDTTLQFGPCRWMPRLAPTTVNVAETGETAHNITVAEVVLPQRGDPWPQARLSGLGRAVEG